MLTWLVVAVILVLAGLLLYWTLVVSEGSYFGARFVTWLYDLSAARYDDIKKFNADEEDWYVGLPLWHTLQTIRQPLVLDVATGTGRLPQALLRRALFDGRIVALDLSRQMLRLAREKLASYGREIVFLQQNAMRLPFPDETFDAVTCLEALEFLPDPARALREMVRVLRPGGVLFTTNRVGWEARLLPGKALTAGQLRALLNGLPLQETKVRRWQVFYDQVWARKNGRLAARGHADLALTEILRCPHCPDAALEKSAEAFRCPSCRRVYRVEEGILLLDEGAIPDALAQQLMD
jgi:ubiquinone/menaquinone biosynthesis C-methylase UbiE/uncharacterized protein YbaR (Trm112 family)